MFTDINKFTDSLVKYELTAHQFFILYLIDTEDLPNLNKYINSLGKFDGNDIQVLLDKGYVINTNPNDKHFNLGSLVVTLEYAEEKVEGQSDIDLFEELLDAYPPYVIVNNVKYSTKGLSFQDEEKARIFYIKEIRKSKVLHAEILSLIRKWRDIVGDVAPFKIDKFLTSRHWIELRNITENHVRPRIY